MIFIQNKIDWLIDCIQCTFQTVENVLHCQIVALMSSASCIHGKSSGYYENGEIGCWPFGMSVANFPYGSSPVFTWDHPHGRYYIFVKLQLTCRHEMKHLSLNIGLFFLISHVILRTLWLCSKAFIVHKTLLKSLQEHCQMVFSSFWVTAIFIPAENTWHSEFPGHIAVLPYCFDSG
jgi:hypothetical protein